MISNGRREPSVQCSLHWNRRGSFCFQGTTSCLQRRVFNKYFQRGFLRSWKKWFSNNIFIKASTGLPTKPQGLKCVFLFKEEFLGIAKWIFLYLWNGQRDPSPAPYTKIDEALPAYLKLKNIYIPYSILSFSKINHYSRRYVPESLHGSHSSFILIWSFYAKKKYFSFFLLRKYVLVPLGIQNELLYVLTKKNLLVWSSQNS